MPPTDRRPSTGRGSAAAIRKLWDRNPAEVARYVGPVLDADASRQLEHLAHRYLDGRGALFDRRVWLGRVCDGHGDLRAEDIFCLDDGPRILDCLEFDDRLRHGDALADVAFLAMDLEELGRPELAHRFLVWYAELSADAWPASLAHHYISARAHVRCKVACLRSGQGDADAAAEAAGYLELAVGHLEQGVVQLVLVGGLPASGKTLLAAGLSEYGVDVVLSSGETRKRLSGLGSMEPASEAYGEGIYRAEVTEATYAELLERAGSLLGLGETVVLDASSTRARHRTAAREVAVRHHADLVELWCSCADPVRTERLRERTQSADPPHQTPTSRWPPPWPSGATPGPRRRRSTPRSSRCVPARRPWP